MSERGDVADWLGTGLQSPLIGFDSRRRLKPLEFGSRRGRLVHLQDPPATLTLFETRDYVSSRWYAVID